MEKSPNKLIVNAEAFGFGPTAAIATLFPLLRERFEHLSYIGKDHTLDLQKNLPYDFIVDCSSMNDKQIVANLSEHDILLTAMDFEVAALGKQAGLKVILFDSLTWYWAEVPETVKNIDLYLAQDFFGVNERIKQLPHAFPSNTQIIPPMVSSSVARAEGKHILVNLGGLLNPYRAAQEAEKYAEIFINVIRQILPNERIIFATSDLIAKKFDDPNIRSFSREEMKSILQNTKCAFMTPGLGNIYDAAKFGIPTVWLPPANDSQGQQLELLKKHELIDSSIDWQEFSDKINYFIDQLIVLENINQAMLNMDSKILENLILESYNLVRSADKSRTTKLLQLFGTNGAEIAANAIHYYSKNLHD